MNKIKKFNELNEEFENPVYMVYIDEKTNQLNVTDDPKEFRKHKPILIEQVNNIVPFLKGLMFGMSLDNYYDTSKIAEFLNRYTTILQ